MQPILLEGKVLPMFPCLANKKPATPHSFKDATADPAAIAALWRSYWGPLVGLPTGERSGLDVLDIDLDGLSWLGRNNGRLPLTRMHETRSGGRHLFFVHRPGLRCSTSKIDVGIDVRADGGYVVWWPATGGRVLCDVPPAEWPLWLSPSLDNRPSTDCFVASRFELPIPASSSTLTVHPRSREASYAYVALRHAMNELLNSRSGERNTKLNIRAYSLGRLAARGWITVERVVQGLELACEFNFLTRDDGPEQVRATIASGLKAGMERPYPDDIFRKSEA